MYTTYDTCEQEKTSVRVLVRSNLQRAPGSALFYLGFCFLLLRSFRRLYFSTFNFHLLTSVVSCFSCPFSNFYFPFSNSAAEAAACRRRGRRGRGGGRRVRWRSTGPRGRGGGENRPLASPLSANCIRCSSRRGCGRNCTPAAPEARRGPGTAPPAGSGANSKSIGRARARGWPFATS